MCSPKRNELLLISLKPLLFLKNCLNEIGFSSTRGLPSPPSPTPRLLCLWIEQYRLENESFSTYHTSDSTDLLEVFKPFNRFLYPQIELGSQLFKGYNFMSLQNMMQGIRLCWRITYILTCWVSGWVNATSNRWIPGVRLQFILYHSK